MNNKIDITMTATLRPEIIERTLSTFKQNLFKNHPCRLIINIDPVGLDVKPMEIVDLCGRYFREITFNIAQQPSFPKAFIWTWQQVETDYLFHLEDDWCLLREVDLQKMLDLMEKHKDLATLRLSAKPSNKDNCKSWNKFLPWNGEFFECPENLIRTIGMSGHPSLIRGRFVKRTIVHLDDRSNPEKQFHHFGHMPIMQEVFKWRYGLFMGREEPKQIQDIGQRWLIDTDFRKNGPNKAFFTVWERKE